MQFEIVDIVNELPKQQHREWAKRTLPIDNICIHHSATLATFTPRQFAIFHTNPEPAGRNYPAIAYHYVIGPCGTIWKTLEHQSFSWHGHNWNTGLGVCLVGNFSFAEPTNLQLEATRWLIARLRRQLGVLPIRPHKSAPRASTECPGTSWAYWKDFLEQGEEIMQSSLFGVHFQTSPKIGSEPTETIRNSRIEWIKGIDPHAWHSPPDIMFPGKRVLSRLFIGGDDIEHEFMRGGRPGAEAYFARIRHHLLWLKAHGCLDWLGPNEPHPGLGNNDPKTMELFWLRLIELFVAEGGRPWVWSFGVGWPNRDMAHYHVDSIRQARMAGGGLEVHEYGAPSVMDGDGWWTLRIRNTLKELYEAGLEPKDNWVIVGECGITWALVGQEDMGWQYRPDWVYPAQLGLPEGVMNEERFWRQMSWLDDEYRKLPEIITLTPFLTNPLPRWATFDWGTSLIRRSAEKIEATWQEPVTDPLPSNEEIAAMIQKHIVPLNPEAALQRSADAQDIGLIPAMPEVYTGREVVQAFRTPHDPGVQYIARVKIGDWGKVKWFTRDN